MSIHISISFQYKTSALIFQKNKHVNKVIQVSRKNVFFSNKSESSEPKFHLWTELVRRIFSHIPISQSLITQFNQVELNHH